MKEILLTSSVLILALLGLRALFRGAVSRRTQYALWGLVLVRLLVPVSLPATDHSVLTAAAPVGQTVTATLERPALYVPVDRAPLTDHPAAPDLAPGQAMPEDASSVWVADTDETAVRYRQLSAGTVLTGLWLAGAAGMGAWLLSVNLRFGRKLRKGRTPYTVDGCKYPVYLVAEGLPSPCLFGLLRPAIYLTPAAAASPEALRHVIAHETAHARQGDPLWSLLRCVCLAVYWFDPLVWAAAYASRTDCELACDERALRSLGEAERIPYGRTLLALVPVRRGPSAPLLSATTMTAGKRHLKERIARIAENRQTRAVALFAVLALAAGVCAVTFTGGKQAETRPLTGEELAYFNETFFNGEDINIRNQFLTSLYASPEDIDLFELFYCGTGLADPMTDEELQQVGAFDANGEAICPTNKLSVSAMDAVLLENTGRTLAETAQVGLENFDYLPEYNAYYCTHGDTNYFHGVRITAGEREGDTLRLYYPDSSARYPDCDWLCVTLAAQPDGGYWFVSNQPAEAPAVPTVYPAGDPALTLPLDGLTPCEAEAAAVERHTDDCAERYGGFMADEDTTFRIYRSTDGNLYAAVEYETAAGSGGMSVWDVGCFFTFSEDVADGDQVSLSSFDLFGRHGVVISYPGQISAHQYGTINDYYYVDDSGAPALLARAYGTPELLDLDGNGQNELAASSGSTAQLFFQREGQLYQADIAALLADAWPEADHLDFGYWDASRRCLPLSGAVTLDGVTVSADRYLYFDGARLLLYKDGATYTDHVADAIDVPEAVLAAARDRVLEKLDWWRNHTGVQSYEDGQWQDTGPQAEWDDWRITRLILTDTAPAYPQLGLQIYSLGYELHSPTPGKVAAAGGMYIDEDGWVGGMYDEAPFLVFHTLKNSGPTLLENSIPGDVGDSSQGPMFAAAVAGTALQNGLLTPSEVTGKDLFYLFFDNQTAFFNLMGGYDDAQQEAAFGALVAYAASGAAGGDAGSFAEDLQNPRWGPGPLTDQGQAAWERLKALAADYAAFRAQLSSASADPAGEFRDFTPPEVLEAALEAAEADYSAFRTKAEGQYDGWRLTYLDSVTGYEPFQTVPLEIYRMSWDAHTSQPESVVLAGGMEIDAEGWVRGINGAPYLVFLQEGDHYRLLGRDIASDVSPDAPFFRAELAGILLDQGLVTPEDIGAETLLHMFRDRPAAFLNRMGALPQDQQAYVVEALASFHHQGLFEEEDTLRDAIQTAAWGRRDLDAGGAALLGALLDRTGIHAYGIGDSYGDRRTAIQQALVDYRYNASAHKDDFYAVAHRVLDTRETGCTTTVYLLTCFGSYDAGPEGGHTLETSGIAPVSLTFARVNGLYQLTEYWEPRGGADYASDLGTCFPPEAAEAALDPGADVLENLQSRMEQEAAAQFAQAEN